MEIILFVKLRTVRDFNAHFIYAPIHFILGDITRF